ncbi:MAG: exopolysaccharide biosynthesis polyprenyl glycosylphosphotransferase [Flavobacteriales bacterium]|jgi:putative colanic acid biosynthesis UDP-glucose lipid carrier transferase|nr:exopolysaccharide biosynthesis polyprenyl glycosylphosphotransferase [Flavobacteriales bacterium]MBK6882930.1 exopolysaccharide biosynthesis polyprenyl glycosylphosphotransferase [Flavobacteriales bacterium]MBK7101918.1 exopolysaccharide biosynthesis polyprenyl glycosylphosphotransferase [Flavobacteriales bacterium]MBK7114268.1 exopolysaccharide biosynthesis polyprenyl glycosylphosphotransferase [Flavobacteriales bacterium]MBK7483666.1 exopolysaccharide biosynthesis polyprenyl glycosylphosph
MEKTLDPNERLIVPGAELSAELSTLLRSGRTSLQHVQTGITKVLTFEPLTTVKDLIIVGEGPAAEEIFQYCEDQTVRGYRFCGIFNDEPIEGLLGKQRFGDVEAAKAFAIQNRIDILYCALPGTRRAEITDLMEFCERNTIRFRVIPSAESFIPVVKTSDLEFHGAVPVSKIRKEPLDSAFARGVKRAFDIAFSLGVILFIFTWLFPILAMLVKLSGRGPVFFKQIRLGKDNEEFVCWKFRSMRMNVEADSKQATKNDPRVTAVGRFLRKSNLDEMPQFINVLFGHMSIVGPRPHPLRLNDQYRDIIDKYMVRHFVRPGITGWAQVSGFRGETRTPELMERRVELDVWYLENWSFWLDLRIVVKTVTNMLSKDANAY